MAELVLEHPKDQLLRKERIPHIWCPGCGLGSVLSSLIDALGSSGLDLKNVAVVSGIGCSGRAAGYLNLDSFHTTHGRAIPYATGLKLANPDLTVVVFSGDGDLVAIGGNHLVHAARRNIDLKVVCINNFNFGMTGGQCGPTTPRGAKTTTTSYGNVDRPFNLMNLLAACGAPYVARWTSVHPHYMKIAMGEMLQKDGFSFLEVIAPCPTNFGRRNKMRDLNLLKRFLEQSTIEAKPDLRKADIEFDTPILCGKFVDLERPSFVKALEQGISARVKVAHFRGDGRVPLEEDPPKAAAVSKPPKEASAVEKTVIERPIQIKLAGLGGQGIGLLGLIIGRAAAVYDNNQAVYTQEYSPEARGGASSSSIIIASEQINMPYVTEPDIMVSMAQGAYNKYQKEIMPKSTLMIDEDLVKPKDLPDSVLVRAIPATRMAEEELGRKVVANIIMLGFFTAVVPYVSLKSMQKALKGSIPKGTEELNLKAFEAGYEYGKKVMSNGRDK